MSVRFRYFLYDGQLTCINETAQYFRSYAQETIINGQTFYYWFAVNLKQLIVLLRHLKY